MNRYPLWKYLLILFILLIGVIYALPNLYGEDPALQVSAGRTTEVNQALADQVRAVLEQSRTPHVSVEIDEDQLLVRFPDVEAQLAGADRVREALGTEYTAAINMVPAVPGWLSAIGAKP